MVDRREIERSLVDLAALFARTALSMVRLSADLHAQVFLRARSVADGALTKLSQRDDKLTQRDDD